ncbi:hypothetical protein B0E55_06399 [Rhodococcus sp. 66b]|nr:hypothetical protein B0E55_06399 [Rhodococcus sp. 66b]
MQSALPGVRRLDGSSALELKRRCETTGPAFWLRPIWSRLSTSRPARSAAVASTWLTVTIPVPPMPARNTFCVLVSGPKSGSATTGGTGRAALGAFLPGTSSTVTNEGQSPSMQV